MGIPTQYQQQRLHNVQLTATILAHLSTPTLPALPGRRQNATQLTRLPSLHSLLSLDTVASSIPILPPLQCAVGLIHLSTPRRDAQFRVTSPLKPLKIDSPTSPSMTLPNPFCQRGSTNQISTCSSSVGCSGIKTRRPLSLHDLLSTEATSSSSSSSIGLTQRNKNVHHRRQCGIADCLKYALTGGFCIRHGGGKRCNFVGCTTVAQSGGRCKAHGGGSKCKVFGCGSVARRKGFCMAHGGRQQCKVDTCGKCAHGGGFCIAHGGGKRCASTTKCHKSAQAGGFCYSHGGGKRCAAPECFQAARKGGLCIRHRKLAALQ